MDKLSIADFAAKIKAKYPDYAGIEDGELTRRIVEKYPDYAASVDLGSGGQGKVTADATSRFGSGLYQFTVGPLVDIYRHQQENVEKYGPFLATLKTGYDLAKGLVKGSNDQAVEALKAIGSSRFMDFIEHAPGVVPAVGPAAVDIAETARGGDYAGALGKTAGLGLTLASPKIVGAVKKIPVLPRFTNPNPVETAAAEFGLREGIPVDVGTATGNPVLKTAQAIGERTSIPGSFAGQSARAAQAEALTATGERLAGRVSPSPVVPEQAGAAVRGSLEKTISTLKSEADTAYDKFREIEARPENVRVVQPNPRPQTVKMEGRDVKLADLQPEQRAALGYPDVEPEVRGMIDNAVEMRLKEIQDLYGSGLGSLSGKGKRIEGIEKMNAAAASEEKQGFGHINVKDAIPELAGLKETPGRIAEAIEKDKNNKLYTKVKERVEEETIQWYADQIQTANTEARIAKGAEPPSVDEAYWDSLLAQDEAAIKAGKPIPLPVDMRPIKAVLKPIFDDMETWLEPAKRYASKGYQAAKSIVNGPDYMRASTAEKGLSGLKALAREAKSADMANVSQGLGKFSAKMLQDAIDKVVAGAGDEAIAALRQGRAKHLAKMGVSEVLDKLRTEPVQTFREMIYSKDAGIQLLRKVAKLAPKEMPKIGRAYLEDLLGKATAEGKFNRTDSIWNTWQGLGPETKKIIFRDPALISDLDKFFLLAKKMAENPNPSGTAFTAAVTAFGTMMVTDPITTATTQIGGGLLTKLLYSPKATRLILDGMRIPVSNKAASGTIAASILSLAQGGRREAREAR